MRHGGVDDQWPDGTGQVIAGCDHDDGQPAPAHEPVRDIGHHRPEAGARTDADQQQMGGREYGEARRQAGDEKAQAEAAARHQQRDEDAGAVRQSAEPDRADGKAQHGHGVGRRRCRAVDAELRLHLGQHDDDGPHAGAHQRRDQQRQAETDIGIAAVGRVGVGGGCHDRTRFAAVRVPAPRPGIEAGDPPVRSAHSIAGRSCDFNPLAHGVPATSRSPPQATRHPEK